MNRHARLDRRTLLKSSCGTAALGSLAAGMLSSATLAAESKSDKPRIRKTLKYSMVKEKGSMLEKFKMLKEIGFDGVELDGPSNLDLKEVLEARDQSGLVINGLVLNSHWKRPFSDPNPRIREQTVEDLKKALRQAREYGATSVLIVPGVVRGPEKPDQPEITYAEAYERSQPEIRKALSTAEETGVVIAIENVWSNFLLSPLEEARFIDEFKSPLVRAHFDIGNVLRYGWPQHWILALGKRVFKLDTKGYSKKIEGEHGPGKGFDVEIGDPDDSVNYPAVNKALRDVGYVDGWIAAEVNGGDRARMVDIHRRLDMVLAR